MALLGVETGLQLPSFAGFGSTLGTTMNWILFIVLITGTFGFISWWIYRSKIYYINAFFFERISGQRPILLNLKPIKLRVVKIGINEGEMLWCKSKGYLPAEGYKMGVNTYFFEKNPKTGYWQPFYLTDFDQQQGAVDIDYISNEFKGTASISRRLTEIRHKSKKMDLDKIITYGVIILVVIATLVWSYYTYKQNKDFDAQASARDIERLKIEAGIISDLKAVSNKLDQIQATSGIRTAPIP